MFVLDIQDKPKASQWLLLSFQDLFTMFGATVLVPILVGIDPSVALFSSCIGTMVYIIATGAKIPAYLGEAVLPLYRRMTLLLKDPDVGLRRSSARCYNDGTCLYHRSDDYKATWSRLDRKAITSHRRWACYYGYRSWLRRECG